MKVISFLGSVLVIETFGYGGGYRYILVEDWTLSGVWDNRYGRYLYRKEVRRLVE